MYDYVDYDHYYDYDHGSFTVCTPPNILLVGMAIMDLKTLTLFQLLCLRGILDKQWTPCRARKGSCSIVQDKNRKEGIGDGYPGGEIVADIPMEMLFLHSKVY